MNNFEGDNQVKVFITKENSQVQTVIKSLRLVKIAGLACVMSFAQNAYAASNSLIDISHITLQNNQQQLAFTLSDSVPEPRSFSIDNPARIAIDLPDTENALSDRTVNIGAGLIQDVTTVEAGGRTRIVVNMASMIPYSTTIAGNQLLVTFNDLQNGFAANEVPSDADTAQTSAVVAAATAGQQSFEFPSEFATEPTIGAAQADNTSIVTAQNVTGQAVETVDFRRGPLGEGRVIFKLSGAGINPDMRQEGGRIIIEFPDTTLPADLERRLDVTDFGTPVSHIDTKSNRTGARAIIKPSTEFYEHLAYQSDDIFTIELKPKTKDELEEERREKFGYVGEKLSLNFQDIEVRSVLQLLADFTNLNLVVSDTVQGKLTLRLKNVPWDQALDIILQTKALDKREAGNVIMIAPAEEIANRERIALEGQKQKVELAPLRTEFFQANYAKAEELAELLKSGTGSILSERGSVSVDNRTNTLLINDTSDQLAEIRALVHRLDVPIRQVLIESRIVIATDDFNKDLGVRWGINRNTTTNDGEGFAVSGNQLGIDNLIDQEPLGQERFNVNLPATNAAGSLSLALARLPFGTLLELELSAMQAEGQGEVISSPRVITANQHEAYIEQGVEIPYLEASSSGATSVSFRKAVLGLKVKPQITPDDRIVMDLQVNRDTVGEIFGAGNLQVPSIDTRELSTQVLVDNGETIVLGGVYEQRLLDSKDSVPFFSDLPLVGKLFQRTRKEDDKSELLVFVTPKIVRDNASIDY